MLNKDGKNEVIGISIGGTEQQIYISDGQGNLLLSLRVGAANYPPPAIGDLDGDGDLELIGLGRSIWILVTNIIFTRSIIQAKQLAVGR